MRIELMYTDLQSAASPLRQLACLVVGPDIALPETSGKVESSGKALVIAALKFACAGLSVLGKLIERALRC